MSQLPAPSLITELEVRQDEALQSLAELEERIVLALSHFGGLSPSNAKGAKALRSASGPSNQVPTPGNVELKLHHPEEVPAAQDDSAAA